MEELESENHSIIDSDSIRIVSSSINTTHPSSLNVDINVLQLPNSDDMISHPSRRHNRFPTKGYQHKTSISVCTAQH